MMKQTGKRIGALLLALVLAVTMQTVAVSAKTHTLANSMANQILGSRTCEYGGRIYYGYDDKIFSVKKDGTDKKTVYTMEDAKGLNGFSHLIVYDSNIYAIFDYYGGSDTCNSQLIRVGLDGGDFRNYGNAASVALVDGKLYYTKAVMNTNEEGYSYMENTGIYVMDLDGSNSKPLVKKSGIYLAATDGAAIYYRSYNARTDKFEMYRCDMQGKNRKKLLSSSGSLNCFAVSGNYLYYGLENYKLLEGGGSEWTTTIYRKSMKDSSKKKIYTCQGSITNCYVDGTKLYVSNYKQGLVRVDLSTGKSRVLNKHTGAGIRGVHGSVMVFEQFRMDEKNGTDIDMILARTSTGKKIKKIGAYFVS